MHLISVLQPVLSDPTSSSWLSVESSMPSVASPSPTWSATTRRTTGGILWRPCQTLLQNSQLVNARAKSMLLEDTLHEVTNLLLLLVGFYLIVSKALIIFSFWTHVEGWVMLIKIHRNELLVENNWQTKQNNSFFREESGIYIFFEICVELGLCYLERTNWWILQHPA